MSGRWLFLLALAIALGSPVASGQERAKREMKVWQLGSLGVQIWVEQQPAWTVSSYYEGGQKVFMVSTPPGYYPPANMTYVTFRDAAARRADVRVLAHGLVDGIHEKFGGTAAQAIDMKPADYNGIAGFETTFTAKHDGAAYDVRVFVGKREGYPPLAMEVYTPAGMMNALREPIRRAWSNVEYISDGASN